MRKNIFAEILGTFIIVFIGTGAMILDEVTTGSLTHFGVCLIWGIAVASAILFAGRIHESHYNPAVTLALVFAGKFSAKKSIEHIIAQISGAIIASVILYLLFPKNSTLGSTLPTVSPWETGFIEIIISFLLMATIAMIDIFKIKNKIMPAVIIGSVVLLMAYFAGPLTGASMNPARSIGPAIISGHTEYLLVYLIAPMLGMLLAVPLYKIKKTNSN
jgi:aquaporin NIP